MNRESVIGIVAAIAFGVLTTCIGTDWLQAAFTMSPLAMSSFTICAIALGFFLGTLTGKKSRKKCLDLVPLVSGLPKSAREKLRQLYEADSSISDGTGFMESDEDFTQLSRYGLAENVSGMLDVNESRWVMPPEVKAAISKSRKLRKILGVER